MATKSSTELRPPAFNPRDPMQIADDDVNVDELATFARRHRVLITVVLLSSVALGLLVALLIPRTYTARASFVPQQGRTPMSGLASLAAQFGVTVPTLDATRSPSFYVNLLDSKNLLLRVVSTNVSVPGPAGTKLVSLVDYLHGRGDTPGKRAESAVKKLRRHLDIGVDQKAGLVAVEVQLWDASVARDVAKTLVAQLDSFNLRSRQSQAILERKFTEGRLQEARRQLRQAEDELMAFLQRNRDFRSSPQLTFLHDRLEQNVSLNQQLHTTLTQAYEQARIEEVRDTPVITLVEDPLIPARADTFPYVRAILGGLAVGIAVSAALGRRRDRLSRG